MDTAAWVALVGLGAFHGVNPGMGWLFAVALGLQEGSRGAVLRAVPPIAAGHALAVLLALVAVEAVRAVLDVRTVAALGAAALIGFGLWRLARRRHPRWVGMRVRARELVLWSFLMASAHGAGLMLLPVALHLPHLEHPATGLVSAAAAQPATLALSATLVHSVAMLVVLAAVAVLVYDLVGVRVLRRGWVNLDLVWAVALITAGVITLVT